MGKRRAYRTAADETPLRRARLAKGLTIEQMAERLGRDTSTVSRWERGKKLPSLKTAREVAREYGVNPDALLPEAVARTVPLVGYVGAGAEAHYYAATQGTLDEVPAPDDVTPETVAVEIRGDSLGSFFDRWLVYYDDVRRPVTSDLINKLCVVGLQDEKVLIKKLKKGQLPDCYTLLSQFEPPIYDVPVEWAARVKTMVPR